MIHVDIVSIIINSIFLTIYGQIVYWTYIKHRIRWTPPTISDEYYIELPPGHMPAPLNIGAYESDYDSNGRPLYHDTEKCECRYCVGVRVSNAHSQIREDNYYYQMQQQQQLQNYQQLANIHNTATGSLLLGSLGNIANIGGMGIVTDCYGSYDASNGKRISK